MKLTYTNVNGYLIPNLTYKSIFAKLFHLLTGFIGEIGNQISIHICISQFPGLTIFSQNLKVS